MRKISTVVKRFLADSEYGEYHRILRLRTTETQDRCCLYLEGKGLRFCVDYGYQNAEAIALSRFGYRPRVD